MRGLPREDTRAILLSGGVAIVAYAAGMAVLWATGVIGGVGSAGFIGGFLVFMAVFFASMAVSGYFE